MEFKILLLDDNVDQATFAVKEALDFGGMITISTQWTSGHVSGLPNLLSMYVKLKSPEDESISIVLFHNAKEIDAPPLVDDLVSEIKEKEMLFDLILIDDNWGGGKGYRYGQQKILPSLFSSTQGCHYCLFTQHIDQNERIQEFSGLLQRDEYQGTGRIHLVGKDEKHNLYSLISRLISEKCKRIEIERELVEASEFCNIVGNSPLMRDVYATIAQAAPSDSTILIRGEHGTGKDLVARAIHDKSNRRDKNFVAINCAAIVDSLSESELFGHEKGAFTGAFQQKKGWFETATDGTIFLDEIGDLNHPIQAKLLRVLESRTFFRVGGTTDVKTKARIIAATNRELEKMIQEGEFREDLFYRLNIIVISVPPLRERSTDIPLLAHHFVVKHANRIKKPIPTLTPDALQVLVHYNWPGNVRELSNCIERAIVLSNDSIITIDHLPEDIRAYHGGSSEAANMINPDGKVAELYPDEKLRARARQYLERWEKACQQYPNDELITQKKIGSALGMSDKAIIGTCKTYGDVMRAFLEEDQKRGSVYYPLLLKKTNILTWKSLSKSKTPDREKRDT